MLQRVPDERVWEEPLKDWRRPFKDTGPDTLLKWDGKMYILTPAPNIASSLNYRELPVTSVLPNNLLMVNPTGPRTPTQCHWVHYQTQNQQMWSLWGGWRELCCCKPWLWFVVQGNGFVCRLVDLACEDVWIPEKDAGGDGSVWAGRWERRVERKLAWVLG